MADAFVFFACLVDSVILIAMTIYFILCLSDLEFYSTNTQQGCKKLNQRVIPEIVAAIFIPVVLLLSWHWFLFLLSSPFACYLMHRFMTLPHANLGAYDPTDIRNNGRLIHFQKVAFFKMGYHLIAFFVSLYCDVHMIWRRTVQNIKHSWLEDPQWPTLQNTRSKSNHSRYSNFY